MCYYIWPVLKSVEIKQLAKTKSFFFYPIMLRQGSYLLENEICESGLDYTPDSRQLLNLSQAYNPKIYLQLF